MLEYNNEQALSTSKASKLLGVHPNTLRNWIKNNKIDYYRTQTGRYYYFVDRYLQHKNIKKSIILYSRVSSYKQKDDLERQRTYLRQYSTNKQSGHTILEFSDVASGLNFKRKSLLQILGLVKKGTVSTIVVASKDRLARFGTEIIEWLCNEYGTKIVVLDSENKSRELELSEDLLSVVQVYCCRWNGQRRYKSKS
jgi:excisionase family DNA binding protein